MLSVKSGNFYFIWLTLHLRLLTIVLKYFGFNTFLFHFSRTLLQVLLPIFDVSCQIAKSIHEQSIIVGRISEDYWPADGYFGYCFQKDNKIQRVYLLKNIAFWFLIKFEKNYQLPIYKLDPLFQLRIFLFSGDLLTTITVKNSFILSIDCYGGSYERIEDAFIYISDIGIKFM